MLTAKKVLDPSAAEKLCTLCGTEFDADRLYYAIYENDGSELPAELEIPTVLGVCGFGFKGKCAVIYDIMPKKDTYDLEAMFILGRAVLNFVDLCGFKDAEYRAGDLGLAKHLEFAPDGDGILRLSLVDYFTEPCKRHGCK